MLELGIAQAQTQFTKLLNQTVIIGEVDGGILTVRFTYRENIIRIFGAGYWRKGKKSYEKNN